MSWRDRAKPATPGDAPAQGGWRARARPVEPQEPEKTLLDEVGEVGDAAMRGVAQGSTFGFADELTAGLGAAGDVAGALLGTRGDIDLDDAYRTRVDSIRKADKASQEESPWAYGAGNVGGAIATSVLGGAAGLAGKTLGGRAAVAAAEGGLGAAGASEANPLSETGKFLGEVGAGAALGGVLQAGTDKLLPKLAQVGKKGGKKLMSSLGGVAEDNIDTYLANPQAVRGAKELEEIKDLVDSEVARPQLDAQEALQQLNEASAQLTLRGADAKDQFAHLRELVRGKVAERKTAWQDAVRQKLDSLKAHEVPLAQAKELTERIAAERGILGQLSEQADEALAQTPGTFRKQDLLDMVDQVGASQGKALIGDEATDASRRFYEMRERMAGGLSDEIPYQQMRDDVLGQIRADIKKAKGFNQSAGEFNQTLTGMRKEATGKISDALKAKSPRYKELMEEMAPRSRLLEEMDGYFGTPEKALSTLQTIAGGKGARAQAAEDALNRYVQLTGNTDLVDKLKTFKEARRVLGSQTERAALERSLPEYRAVQRAEQGLAKLEPRQTQRYTELALQASPDAQRLMSAKDRLGDAQQIMQETRGWTPATSESRLKSVMAGRSIENRKALEALERRSGLPFQEMLKSRAVADAFDKGFMHGSRNVNLWSIVGTLLGGTAALGGKENPIAKLIGGSFGATVDRFGPKMTQKALDAFMTLRDSPFLPVLEKAASRGKDALSSTHLLLRQNYPDYRALFEDEAP